MRQLSVFALIVCLAVFISGCGDSSYSTSETPATSRQVTSTAPADSAHEDFGGASDELAGFGEYAEESGAPLNRAAVPASRPAGGDRAKSFAAEPADPASKESPAGMEIRRTPDVAIETGTRRTGEHARPAEAIPASPKYQHQAGTLTAGSLDDHVKFDEFRKYISETLQSGIASPPNFDVNSRAVIKVINEQGQSVSDARIVVNATSPNQQVSKAAPLLVTQTGSDGRSLFMANMDARGQGNEFYLSVTAPDSQETITNKVTLEEIPWTVTVPKAESKLPQQLDLALVIDTTGSMSDELEFLKAEIDSIAASVRQRFPKVDQRYSLILYRDQGDQYVTRTFDFTDSLVEFRQTLSEQRADGGGNYPEAMHLALEQSTELSWRKKNTARVMFLVADAPPHNHALNPTFSAIDALRKNDVAIFPIAASGVREQAEVVMRSAAFLTNSQYLFLTDHSGVGNPHAKPKTSKYNVERLDQLMIRMIAGELSGRKLLPTDIIATEETDGSQPPEQTLPAQETSAISQPMLYCATAPPGMLERSWGRWAFLGICLLACCFLDRLC
ncbi:MAG: hypothetical protein CMJ78_16480 [Planctomycetaceae bacterium]|nr:hypothetical protein [Planctomycetaceae bacterium]